MASSMNRKASVVATEATEDMRGLIWLRGKEKSNHTMPLGHMEDTDLYLKRTG